MSKRMLDTNFWLDPYVEDLDSQERLLYLYLITNPYTNCAGIYEISFKRVSQDTGIDRDMVKKLLGRFQEAGKVFTVDSYILLINHMKHQAPNQNVVKGMIKIFEQLPEKVWQSEGMRLIAANLERLSKPSESLLKPLNNLTKLNLTKSNLNNTAGAEEKSGVSGEQVNNSGEQLPDSAADDESLEKEEAPQASNSNTQNNNSSQNSAGKGKAGSGNNSYQEQGSSGGSGSGGGSDESKEVMGKERTRKVFGEAYRALKKQKKFSKQVLDIAYGNLSKGSVVYPDNPTRYFYVVCTGVKTSLRE